MGFHKLATWGEYSLAPSSDFRSGEKIFHGPRRVLGFGGFIYQKPDTRLSTYPEVKIMRFSRTAGVTALLLAALVISLGAVDSAWARGGRGYMNANLTPEQSAQLFDLKQQFMNDTAGLRKQMMVKRTELAALWQNATPDQNQIQAKQQEVNALRDQLQAKRTAFRQQNQQICPQAGMGAGRGAGQGMAMGRGGGQGRGCNW
jgi:Spy/CpxP family protein refolding chaperone